MARLTKTVDARRDVDDIWMHIATKGRGVDAAQKVVEEFDAAFDLLARMPGAGAGRTYLPPDLRAFAVPPYLIVYRVSGSRVSILRVLHGARDIERIFR